MELFKFVLIFCLNFLLCSNVCAETESKWEYKKLGDNFYVKRSVINPDNVFGKDIKIASSVPLLGGMQVNVWQCMQLCAIVKYVTGIRSEQIKEVMPVPLQYLLFPSTGAGDSKAVEASGIIEKSNDPVNGPTYVVDLHTRWRFALSGGSPNDAIGISFSNGDATGFNMRVDTAATLSSLSIWAMKCAENSFVGYIAEKDGFNSERWRFGYKIVELLASVAWKRELRLFFPDFFRTSLPNDESQGSSEQLSSHSSSTSMHQPSSPIPSQVAVVTFDPQTSKTRIKANGLSGLEMLKKEQIRDQDDFVLDGGSMPFSSISDLDGTKRTPKSDLAEFAQTSGSVIPPSTEEKGPFTENLRSGMGLPKSALQLLHSQIKAGKRLDHVETSNNSRSKDEDFLAQRVNNEKKRLDSIQRANSEDGDKPDEWENEL